MKCIRCISRALEIYIIEKRNQNFTANELPHPHPISAFGLSATCRGIHSMSDQQGNQQLILLYTYAVITTAISLLLPDRCK